MTTQEVIVVLVTVPNLTEAESLSALLVEKRAAACVNIVPGVMSIFSWEGSTTKENELLLIIKTVRSEYEHLESLIQSKHSYSCPEVLALDVAQGATNYCNWVNSNTGKSASN